MKVLDPKKLWNFVDYNIFIWICLGPQTIFFCFFVSNCDFWNLAKILLLVQTAQSSITLAKLAGPYISSHLDIYMLLLYIYAAFTQYPNRYLYPTFSESDSYRIRYSLFVSVTESIRICICIRTLSVFESESEQKYENKYNMSDIRSYPIRFHP